MALPTIVFNSSTGSDTAASGAGPSTALSGNGASCNATTSVDLSANSPNLSGVATDGSACLWVDTTTGRQFSRITAVDNATKIVTVATAYSVTESGRNWGIGGKRATFGNTNSRKLFTADAQAGWIIETETDQSISTSLGAMVSGSTSGVILIRGSGGTRPVILQTGASQAHIVLGSYCDVTYLKFTNSNATKNSAAVRFTGISRVWDCVFGDATNKLFKGFDRSSGSPLCRIWDCEVCYCTQSSATSGAADISSQVAVMLLGCWIHDNSGVGVVLESTVAASIIGNIINNNTGDGIYCNDSAVRSAFILGNVVDGNGGDGLDISLDADASDPYAVMNNIFSNNANYGIRKHTDNGAMLADYNNFYQNTSGARLNLTAGANDLALDPQYVNRAGNNFAIGTNLKEKGFPLSTRNVGANNSATVAYNDIGIQRQESGGGGAASLVAGTGLIR